MKYSITFGADTKTLEKLKSYVKRHCLMLEVGEEAKVYKTGESFTVVEVGSSFKGHWNKIDKAANKFSLAM